MIGSQRARGRLCHTTKILFHHIWPLFLHSWPHHFRWFRIRIQFIELTCGFPCLISVLYFSLAFRGFCFWIFAVAFPSSIYLPMCGGAGRQLNQFKISRIKHTHLYIMHAPLYVYIYNTRARLGLCPPPPVQHRSAEPRLIRATNPQPEVAV